MSSNWSAPAAVSVSGKMLVVDCGAPNFRGLKLNWTALETFLALCQRRGTFPAFIARKEKKGQDSKCSAQLRKLALNDQNKVSATLSVPASTWEYFKLPSSPHLIDIRQWGKRIKTASRFSLHYTKKTGRTLCYWNCEIWVNLQKISEDRSILAARVNIEGWGNAFVQLNELLPNSNAHCPVRVDIPQWALMLRLFACVRCSLSYLFNPTNKDGQNANLFTVPTRLEWRS